MAVDTRSGESRVAGVLEVEFAAVESFAQQTSLYAYGHGAPEKFELRGILSLQTLMAEEAYLVIEELQTGTVKRLEEIERHVSSDIHRLRIILETCHRDGIRRVDVEFGLLAHRSRIE